MRKTALISLVLAVLGAGSFALAASGGDAARLPDVASTARASSVHYHVAVTLTKSHESMTLRVAGATDGDRLVAHIRLGEQTAAVMRDHAFLYEGSPNGVVEFGNVSWLRLPLDGMPPHAHVFSALRSLTPLPLLHVVAEATLRPVGGRVFAGPVAYDDPVVRTALHQLSDGYEFRGLRLRVVVGRDGRLHDLRLTGRTPDGAMTLVLRAHLFDFGKPGLVNPPKPGTFVDPALANLRA